MSRFIYFDLGNVLLNFDNDIAVSQLAKVSGIDPDKVRESIFDSGLQDEYESGTISSEEFVDRFNSATGSACSKKDVLLAVSDMFEPNTAMLPIISQLRVAGYPMGILSNTCQAHWDFIRAKYVFVDEFFRHYILSFEVKAMKPDAAIYQAAAELAGAEPADIFFTDDREENYQGAKKAGFDAVHFTSAIQLAKELRSREIRFNY